MKQWIDSHMDAQIADLQGLLRIPSVSRGEPKPGMPYGQAVNDALEYTLGLAKKLGFPDARSLDGYCGVVDYGEGDEMLMIMAHLDVVPAGAGWSVDPFAANVADGRILARGVADDKSAATSMLYALAAVKAAGIPLKRRVRLFFGCDEESGWGCIDRYKETEPEPDLAFSPDADYPLVNSERGICHVVYEKNYTGSGLRVDCGTAANVIPGEAAATLPFRPVPTELPEGLSAEYGENSVRVTGSGGHAAQPELAHNALQGLLAVLAAQDALAPEDLATVSALSALLAFDRHGEGLGIDVTDESGRLTLSPDMLQIDETGARITLDARCPFALPGARVLEKLDQAFGAVGFARGAFTDKAGHFIPRDSELVTALLSVYEENVGHKAEPLSIGGGTYARAFHNAVGFGMTPEDGISCCHMPDESMTLDEIRFNTVVIAEAIARLAGK